MTFTLQTSSLILDKAIPAIAFMNELPEQQQQKYLTHVFKLDGSVIVTNEFQDTLEIMSAPVIDTASLLQTELFYDEEAEIVKYVFSLDDNQQIIEVFDFKTELKKVKITLIGHLLNSAVLSLPILTSSLPKLQSYNIYTGSIGFDWSDIITGQDGCISYTWDNENNQLKINVENEFEIDPSTVESGISADTPNYQSNNVFYAQELWWVFYSDSHNFQYRTSSDGVTWSSSTIIASGSTVRKSAIYQNGTRIDLVYLSGTSPASMYYRSGTLGAGTITWTASARSIASNVSYTEMNTPSIIFNSTGYPYASYYNTSGVVIVMKGAQSNGTWTSNTFSTSIITLGYDNVFTKLVLLANDKVGIVFSDDTTYRIRVRTYTGSGTTWQSAIYLTSNLSNYGQCFNAVAEGDTIHIVASRDDGLDAQICYIKYTYSTNSFSSWINVSNNTSVSNSNYFLPTITINPNNNDLYVCWTSLPTSRHIYYRKYTAATSTWETIVDWITETNSLMDYPSAPSSLYTISGTETIGISYYYSGVSETVRFALLTLFPTQYGGYKININGTVTELCMVDIGNGNSAFATKCKTNFNGTVRDLYLVETSDANASKVHVNTPQGIKAIRKKT